MKPFSIKELDFKPITIEVGIFDQEVAEYGAYNEFGTSKIPERPFMRTSFDESIDLFMQFNPFEDNTQHISSSYIGKVQETIEQWSTPENAESTIKQKGFNDPLVNTGRLKESIESRIKR